MSSSATSVQLVAHLEVDQDNVYPLVLTQSPNTFFIMEEWIEDIFPGRCEELLFKSYKCQPPQCTPGPLADVKIFDKVEVGVFCAPPDGEVFANGIVFGLVNESKGAPYASLGLAPR
ncbi:hypothetical protein FOZ61_010345 [Perkinsus olseni]|uniref:Uncharacterized protein n=1 Tax=Perkinsus olseni TaxID=32597 RepID=A0A7J6ML47_PEROL|nr:hypothetical protein FOZ61_010345 [Perkinsus olseni]KAF4672225.1 hypothetical protein FOL46_009301 [Perkinsus olseni]